VNCTLKNFKFVFAVLLALLFVGVSPTTNVFAKDKKAKYGTIKIMTNPGGLGITIDGKPYGETLTEYRSFELEPGTHNVVVKLPNGNLWTREIEVPAGRVKCVVVNYRPLPPPPKSPCPFPVNVSAPQTVGEGEIITYAADVSYGGTAGLRYNWTITPARARIMSGAGSPTITVDSTGLGGQRLVATLTVDDGSTDPACAQTAQAVSIVAAEEKKILVAREFDECNNCTFDDQKARLDNLAVELQNDPTTTGYIIAYGGRTSPIGQVEMLMTRARNYLTNERAIDGSRLVIVNGGFREGDSVELWLVPRGAATPRATPTVQAGEVKQTGTTRRRRG
jgi:PEGA domain